MASGQYTQAEAFTTLNGMLHGKSERLQSRQETLNQAVRHVLGEIDLRSTKRSSQLSPNLFDDQYEYTSPTDLKGNALIDIKRQVRRESFERFQLVDETEFDRYKGIIEYRVAGKESDLNRTLLIDGVRGNKKAVINTCNSLTANGTWAATADASNLTLDEDNFIVGGAALNFDMAAGGATGYVENTDMTAVDLSDYEDIGSVFVWVFIPDYSDAEGDTVTNFILRIGSSTSNYDLITVTTTNEGLTFHDGWNLLRFDLNGATATGTPNYSLINFLRFTVTKSASLAADTDWRVDHFVAQIGEIYNVIYYSKFGWQTSANAFLENATATTDTLNVDTEELELILYKAAELGSVELKDYEDANYYGAQYIEKKKRYQASYKTERMKRIAFWFRLKNPNFRYK